MTEDEADKKVETLFDEVTTTKVEIVNGRPMISDEQTIADMEFAAACEAMVQEEKRFQRLDRLAKAQEGVPDNLVEWFDCLEARYKTDKKLWQLFTACDRSVRSNKMFNQFRLSLLRGESTKADA